MVTPAPTGPAVGVDDLIAVIDALPKGGGGKKPAAGSVNKIRQVMDQSTTFGDFDTDINTGGAPIYGNIGNVDNSFKFGYQRAF